MEKALLTLLRVKTPVIGAGRTDAGVHASQFFVHIDTEEIAEIDILIYKLNCVLPTDVVVFDLFKVKDDSHARFDAVSRSYEYHVIQQKNPFDFDLNYTPAQGIERMRVGTPPVLQLAALQEAMKLWEDVDMVELRAASIALQEQFIEEVECDVPELTLASPRDASVRGSQVSFQFEHGYAAMQAVIDRGVIGDFRAPDIMRFGFTPLYLDAGDVSMAVKVIKDVMNNALWDTDAYKVRSRVT